MNFAFIYITGVRSTSGRLTLLLFSAVNRLASEFIKHSEPLISEPSVDVIIVLVANTLLVVALVAYYMLDRHSCPMHGCFHWFGL